MSSEQLHTFDALDVRMGQTIQILSKPSEVKQFYDVMLIGVIPGESLILGAPETGDFPKIEEGHQLVFRIMMTDGIALFSSAVLYISEMPIFMVFADYPREIKFKQVRKANRVNVSLPVLTSNTTSGIQSGVAGRVIDISTFGAGLECYEHLGVIGDQVIVKGKFEVNSIQRLLSVKATIRARKRLSNDSFMYGLEFCGGDEDDLLVLFGYIFNAMAYGNIQKIR
ncbi:hypothetical protein TDB9533_01668 [Thalassocella blandensis]|nr:hypothetical protein TDB9533_01668 [Thalassocella blandensis]